VARRAAGWLPLGLSPEQIGTTFQMLRKEAAGYGRDPQSLSCIVQIGVENFEEVPAKNRRPYTGSMAQIIEDIAALAKAGVEHVFLTIPYTSSGQTEFLDMSAAFYTEARMAGI
jgi:alkanesulfonate monooxygenase SsuD/methylene tetrahydromethanopterin reductase-like flavin-dependent oxidoreductase (luciferase family)